MCCHRFRFRCLLLRHRPPAETTEQQHPYALQTSYQAPLHMQNHYYQVMIFTDRFRINKASPILTLPSGFGLFATGSYGATSTFFRWASVRVSRLSVYLKTFNASEIVGSDIPSRAPVEYLTVRMTVAVAVEYL